MAIATIQEVIDRAALSVGYAAIDNSKGSLFGGRLNALKSPRAIAMINDALTWGYEGGAQSTQDVRNVANYLLWLIGKYGQQAEYILEGGGGGSLIPGGGSTSAIFPIYITSANFESDGISYNNSQIVGYNLMLFINEYTQQWLTASASTFSYSSTGFVINIPNFNANTQSWTIVIEKYNN